MKKLFVLVSCLLVAGCWQSTGSLFGDAKAVQPFRAGKLVFINPDKPADVSHSALTIEKDGSYRLVSVSRDKADLGDAMVLRFVALPGLPKDVFVFEAASDNACKPGQICHPMTAKSKRDYGLVRATKTGAEVFNPDCGKSSFAARLPGVKADTYGGCTFANRASLERALIDLSKKSWKTSVTYKYE